LSLADRTNGRASTVLRPSVSLQNVLWVNGAS